MGNTSAGPVSAVTTTVHPHASGEHLENSVFTAPDTGSSPREWGTPFNIAHLGPLIRFIPTRVGNTQQPDRCWNRYTVHPHASGEHATAAAPTVASVGSSPREWGTQHNHPCTMLGMRFIPTRVGNTPGRCTPRHPESVHPHASGEHAQVQVVEVSEAGSSPREWGTRSVLRYQTLIHTFGSSPREWGTHEENRQRSGRARFIPTRVGNTVFLRIKSDQSTVHPHASGEH